MKEYVLLHTIGFCAGVILDLIVPDPHIALHPIRLIGTLISTCEKILYRRKGKFRELLSGLLLCIVVMTVTGVVSISIMVGSYRLNKYFGVIIEAVAVYFILATASLRSESMKVFDALKDVENDNVHALEGARYALSMIVGRDTDKLDKASIIRATIETVAENTSDGVVAPMLYTAVFGPFGGFLYKSVNTMDSMIGYHNDRYEYFGKTGAISDDIFNFIPSRISALLMIVSSFILSVFSPDYSGKRAFSVWKRDRKKHASPNSAQTESACAGSLGIRLGGTAVYKGITVERPFIGDDTRSVDIKDIKRAVCLLYTTAIILALLVLTVLLLAFFEVF